VPNLKKNFYFVNNNNLQMSDYEDNDYDDTDDNNYDNPDDDDEPEAEPDELNGEEEETMTSPVIDTARDKHVKREDRQPFPYMTKEECTGILGKRTAQLDAGSPSPLEGRFTTVDSYEIAVLELFTKTFPINVDREFPDGHMELWQASELQIPFGFIRIPEGIKEDLKRLIEELTIKPLVVPKLALPSPVIVAQPSSPGAFGPPVTTGGPKATGPVTTVTIPKTVATPMTPKVTVNIPIVTAGTIPVSKHIGNADVKNPSSVLIPTITIHRPISPPTISVGRPPIGINVLAQSVTIPINTPISPLTISVGQPRTGINVLAQPPVIPINTPIATTNQLLINPAPVISINPPQINIKPGGLMSTSGNPPPLQMGFRINIPSKPAVTST
jgi:DNA-directed RNA polymerase subunit K/omega